MRLSRAIESRTSVARISNRRHRESGSLLIIVLWIAFGLVAACSFWVFAERGYLLCVQAGHTDCRQ